MVSGYPTSTIIPQVDGLSTDTPVLGRHTFTYYIIVKEGEEQVFMDDSRSSPMIDK